MGVAPPEGSQNDNTEEEAGGSTLVPLLTHLTEAESGTLQQAKPSTSKINFVLLKFVGIELEVQTWSFMQVIVYIYVSPVRFI